MHTQTVNSLNVEVRVIRDHKSVWHIVVLHSRVDLDNVAALATNVEIVDGNVFQFLGARPDRKGVGSEAGGDTSQQRETTTSIPTRALLMPTMHHNCAHQTGFSR